MKALLVSIALLFPVAAMAGVEQECAGNISTQAEKLVAFHLSEGLGGNKVEVQKPFKTLAPIKNPVDPKQVFQVVEVWAHVYKATYRVHLIYAQVAGEPCLLMGQEVLEHAAL